MTHAAMNLRISLTEDSDLLMSINDDGRKF